MAAGAASELGYTNLLLYQAGMPDWVKNGYPVARGKEPGSLNQK
jgi:rhodanese-related sulfurtransferase